MNYICPYCKSHLDPGEKCDCNIEAIFKKEKTAAAATTTAESAKAPSKSKSSIAQSKTKSKPLYGNPGYKSCIDEAEAQKALIEWCELMSGKYPCLDLIYHVPNEGKRTKTFAALLRALGLKKGVPDLHLPVARGKWHSLYIEMKAEGGKPTIEQSQWLCKLTAQGNKCIIAWSFDFAKDAILAYLNLKNEENEDV